MFLRKIALLVLQLNIFVLICNAQNPGLSKIDKSDLKKHLSFIASDSLQGRRFGTETNGLEITAQYLAEASREIGLKSASEGYFQMVDIVIPHVLSHKAAARQTAGRAGTDGVQRRLSHLVRGNDAACDLQD